MSSSHALKNLIDVFQCPLIDQIELDLKDGKHIKSKAFVLIRASILKKLTSSRKNKGSKFIFEKALNDLRIKSFQWLYSNFKLVGLYRQEPQFTIYFLKVL